MKILIIEDEQLTAKDLARTIQIIEPDAKILPFLATVAAVKQFFTQETDVDIIFSDIALGDGLSFEAFEALQLSIPIIFCTAYETYTLRAFKSFGIDYIVKPFQKQHVEKALLKYKSLVDKPRAQDLPYAEILAKLTKSSTISNATILVHRVDKIIPIPVAEIALFFVENKQTYALLDTSRKYAISESLEQLEERFPQYFRVNRQFLVHRTAIKDANHYFNRKLLVNLRIEFSTPIIVSRLKVKAFLQWLAN